MPPRRCSKTIFPFWYCENWASETMLRKRHRSIFNKNAFTDAQEEDGKGKKFSTDIVLQDIFFPFSFWSSPRAPARAQEINNLWDKQAKNIDFLLIMEQICTFHIRFLCTHQVHIYIQRVESITAKRACLALFVSRFRCLCPFNFQKSFNA